MDVKDVLAKPKALPQSKASDNSQDLKIRRSLETLTTIQVPIAAAQADVSIKQRISNRSDLRSKLNDVINITNLASEATNQIAKLVRSIDGIAAQAKSESITAQRRQILELEANQLVDEIKKTANTASPSGIKPLAGDKISLDLGQPIGKNLDVRLPDGAKSAFGLGGITFSSSEAIASTISSVQSALNGINNLKDAVKQTSEDVESTAASVEVAIQNSEASETSIRDLDEALRVASDTRTVISNNPDKALTSVGRLDHKSLGLLE